jgi:hypothetical protein
MATAMRPLPSPAGTPAEGDTPPAAPSDRHRRHDPGAGRTSAAPSDRHHRHESRADAHVHRDDRARASRRRRGAVAALPLGALAYVGVNNPSAAGSVYPACPSQVLFGVDCPGCGGLRGTHALLHGDVLTALDHNVLLPFLLVLCAYAAALVIGPLFGHRVPVIRPPRWAAVALAGVLVAFTVARNLPVGGLEWLASSAA